MEKGKSAEKISIADKSDNDLILAIQQTGHNDSYVELRRRYENVYYRMCHKYLKACLSLGIKEEDIIGNLDLILFNSAKSFDFARKLKFSTWIANQARYFCLNSMRRGKKVINTFNPAYNTSEIDNQDETGVLDAELGKIYTNQRSYLDSNLKEDEITFIHKEASEIADPVSKRILDLRYGSNKKVSWREITQILNLNYDICKSMHDKTIQSLREKISARCGLTFV